MPFSNFPYGRASGRTVCCRRAARRVGSGQGMHQAWWMREKIVLHLIVHPGIPSPAKALLSKRSWDRLAWTSNFNSLRQWVETHGQLPQKHRKKSRKHASEIRLAVWVSHQREAHKANKLTSRQVEQLESIGIWRWCEAGASWKLQLAALLSWQAKPGHS